MHRYAAQLSKWFEYVPKARVNRRGCGHGRFVTCVAVALQGNLLVVFAEELHASPQAVVNTITSFLGLPSYDVSSFDVNFVRDLYVLCPCGVRIVRLTDTTLLASVHTRYPHFEGSSGWRAESRYSLPIHPDTEARLREFFRPYNQELQRLLGRCHRVLSLYELRVVCADCVVCAARIQAFTCSLVDVVGILTVCGGCGCQVWLAVAEQKHAEYNNTRGVVSKPLVCCQVHTSALATPAYVWPSCTFQFRTLRWAMRSCRVIGVDDAAAPSRAAARLWLSVVRCVFVVCTGRPCRNAVSCARWPLMAGAGPPTTSREDFTAAAGHADKGTRSGEGLHHKASGHNTVARTAVAEFPRVRVAVASTGSDVVLVRVAAVAGLAVVATRRAVACCAN